MHSTSECIPSVIVCLSAPGTACSTPTRHRGRRQRAAAAHRPDRHTDIMLTARSSPPARESCKSHSSKGSRFIHCAAAPLVPAAAMTMPKQLDPLPSRERARQPARLGQSGCSRPPGGFWDIHVAAGRTAIFDEVSAPPAPQPPARTGRSARPLVPEHVGGARGWLVVTGRGYRTGPR